MIFIFIDINEILILYVATDTFSSLKTMQIKWFVRRTTLSATQVDILVSILIFVLLQVNILV